MLFASLADVLVLQVFEVRRPFSRPSRSPSTVAALTYNPTLRLPVMLKVFTPRFSIEVADIANMVLGEVVEMLF